MKHISLFCLSSIFLASTAVAEPLPPTMGWSSWNTFAARISESIICDQAKAMVDLGFADAGYRYMNIDDGYFANRDADGKLIVHPERFPNGMIPVVDYIHSLGLKAGCYSDAGHNTCASYWGGEKGGIGAGMYEHDDLDCNMYFNEMGFDFIKVDFCGGVSYHNSEGLDLDPRERYTAIRNAIDKCGHPEVVMNACRWDYPGTWISEVADSWRISQDIDASWNSVKNIINQSLYLAPYCTPGHYNDMDMLEVGRGMTADEDATHFGMWCIMSSPLLIGCDLTKVSNQAKELMTNPELIALNQDPLGKQAYVVAKTDDGAYILVKDIETEYGTRRAVALYNPTDSEVEVKLDFSVIDLGGEVALRDLATRTSLGNFNGSYTTTLRQHATQFLIADGTERLMRTLYEGEHAYLPEYQEMVPSYSSGTGTYNQTDVAHNGATAGWLGNSASNNMQWRNIRVPKAGEYKITIHYISGADRNFDITVNGTKHSTARNCNSGGWDRTAAFTTSVMLNEGDNCIMLSNSTDWMPDIDYMTIESTDAGIVPVVADKTSTSKAIFNLNGQEVTAEKESLASDIYIFDGKKVKL